MLPSTVRAAMSLGMLQSCACAWHDMALNGRRQLPLLCLLWLQLQACAVTCGGSLSLFGLRGGLGC